MVQKRCANLWLCVAALGAVLDVSSTYAILMREGSEQTPFPAWLIGRVGTVPGLAIAFGLKIAIIMALWAALRFLPKTRFFLDERPWGRQAMMGVLWTGACVLLLLQIFPWLHNINL